MKKFEFGDKVTVGRYDCIYLGEVSEFPNLLSENSNNQGTVIVERGHWKGFMVRKTQLKDGWKIRGITSKCPNCNHEGADFSLLEKSSMIKCPKCKEKRLI